jgi:hypothetical protein
VTNTWEKYCHSQKRIIDFTTETWKKTEREENNKEKCGVK